MSSEKLTSVKQLIKLYRLDAPASFEESKIETAKYGSEHNVLKHYDSTHVSDKADSITEST